MQSPARGNQWNKVVDHREVVQRAAAQAPDAVPSGNVAVTLVLPAEPVLAHIMREEMTRVLVHLLTNAMEHSPAGGEVHVSLSSEGGRAVVSVRDEGTGLNAKILEHLFSPFVTDRVGQTGLSLALAKHFIDQQGGALTAANNDSGPGACFTVTLQLPAVPVGQILLSGEKSNERA